MSTTPTIHDTIVRVYRLPDRTAPGYRFGGGLTVPFIEVDWFQANYEGSGLPWPQDDPDAWEAALRPFIEAKRYCEPGQAYLVLNRYRSFVVEKAKGESE